MKRRWQFCISDLDRSALIRLAREQPQRWRSMTDVFRMAIMNVASWKPRQLSNLGQLAETCREVAKGRGISSKLVRQGITNSWHNVNVADGVTKWTVRLSLSHFVYLRILMKHFHFTAMAEAARLAIRAYVQEVER